MKHKSAIEPQPNPFESIWSWRKFDVIGKKGKKRKGEERRIGRARSEAIDKREKTLQKEYEQSTKASMFMDKKIGEQNEELEEFEKSILRSQRERQITKLEPMKCLKDIVPAAQNNIDTKFIILEKGRVMTEGQQKSCLALVADETAAVHFQLWGDECDAFETGDIVQLTSGIFSFNRNSLILRAGRRGKAQKVGEFTMAYVETPNMSEIRWVPDPHDSKRYVQDVVISHYSRIFSPTS